MSKGVLTTMLAGVDVGARLHSAADNVLDIQTKSSSTAPASCLRPLLGDELRPLPNAEEVSLDFPNDFHSLLSAVQQPPCFLEEPRDD